MRAEFGFERTSCACDECVRFCRVLPGFLCPSDLERMIPADVDPLQWAEKNLLASPGAVVATERGQFRIPTLVPATKQGGYCKFLEQGKCTIHEINPYGCAMYSHEMTAQEGDERTRAALNAITDEKDGLYYKIWLHLHNAGLRSKGPEEKRKGWKR